MKLRNLFDERETVKGPRKCRRAARKPMAEDEAERGTVEEFFVPLNATGVISNPLSGKSTEQ